VLHFAGSVAYSVEGFIEKNNDTLYTDLEALMAASDAPLVPELFDPSLHADAARDEEEAAEALAAAASSYSGSGAAGAGDAGHMSPAVSAFGGGAGKGGFGGSGGAGGAKTSSTATIASRFKQSLGALNATLLATTPHYVRCVKPNKLKRAHTFDHPMVLAQLLYSGVLETVRIRRQGFPFRETYPDFWRRACRVGLPVLVPGAAAIPAPPPPRYAEGGVGAGGSGVGGRPADESLTPEIVAASKAGTLLLCEGLLQAGQWALGRTKIFLKDGALCE